jgi:hypothetical protein
VETVNVVERESKVGASGLTESNKASRASNEKTEDDIRNPKKDRQAQPKGE